MLSRRTVTAIWATAVAFAALPLLGTAYAVVQLRAHALDGARSGAAQVAGAAEAALNRALIGVDALVIELPLLLEPAQRADGGLDAERAHRILASAAGPNLLVRDLALLDADGNVLAAVRGSTPGLGMPLDAAFRRAALAHVPPGLQVSAPAIDEATSERVLYLARAVTLAGARRVLAVAEVPLAPLGAVMAPAIEAGRYEVTLERDDGLLLDSVPQIEASIGRRLAPPPPAGGARQAPSRLGAVPALVVSRPLIYAKLRVVVAAPVDFALAPFRREARASAAAAAGLVLLTFAAAFATQWQMRRLARARAESHRDKATLDRALGAMADGFLLCDADDRVVAWNERYLEMFPWLRPAMAVGVPFERLVGIAARALYPVDPTGARRSAYAELRLQQHRSGYAARDQELEGGVVIHSIERRTPDGGVVGVFRDVTRSERELAAAKEAAEAANAAKSQFLATMSHEMRTPLNGVLGINALLRGTPLDEVQRGYTGTIESCGQALLVLIDDILDLSKIEAGRMELEAIAFDPLRLVHDVVAAMRVRALEKGLALDLHEASPAPALLGGDAYRLRQVIFNLLGNAIKFTERGRITLTLDFAGTADGRREFRFEVADTGIGIAPEALPRLFERFSQADGSTARRFGGSGLGLAISRKLVELMGGTIAVKSEVGAGSTFTVRVPLDAVDAPAPGSPAPPPPPPRTGPALRILVAEDNDVNQIVIAAMLEQSGHRCVVVDDGERAVERARDEDWDCILMDAQMPRMDGETAARAIRALPGPRGRVPIVALTANVMAQNRQAYVAAGMDDCVAKPVSPDALGAALARCRARGAAVAQAPARRATGEYMSSS